MKRINSMVWGTVLLLVGVVLVLDQFDIIGFSSFWVLPIILFALSLIFHLYYFLSNARNEGLLVPGGIMLTYGVMFALSPNNDIFSHEFGLWPLLLIGPAFGLLELYVFSRGTKGSLVPVFVLTVIGGGFLLSNLGNVSTGVILAIVLICLGLGLMVSAVAKGLIRKDFKPQPDKKPEEPSDSPK